MQHSVPLPLLSLSLLSRGGSLPPLLWWQVPSEVFNHLSCKTPFNWNYPLADKLLEPYQGGDIVVRVFHAGRFRRGSLFSLSLTLFPIVFLRLQFSPPVCLFFFFSQLDDLLFLFISVCCSLFFFLLLHFFPALKVAQSSVLSCLFGDIGAVVAASHRAIYSMIQWALSFLSDTHRPMNRYDTPPLLWAVRSPRLTQLMLPRPASLALCDFKSNSFAAVSSSQPAPAHYALMQKCRN